MRVTFHLVLSLSKGEVGTSSTIAVRVPSSARWYNTKERDADAWRMVAARPLLRDILGGQKVFWRTSRPDAFASGRDVR